MTAMNLIVAQAYLDQLCSRRNLHFVELLVAQGCTLRDPLFGEGAGLDYVKARVCEMHRGFPDLAYTIEDVIANAGDQLALRWSARGTHRGSLIGVPATERAIAISGILLLRLAQAKLIAITSVWEPYLMLQQLGLVPGAPEADAPVRSVEDGIRAPTAAIPYAHVDARMLRDAQAGATAATKAVDIDAQWEL